MIIQIYWFWCRNPECEIQNPLLWDSGIFANSESELSKCKLWIAILKTAIWVLKSRKRQKCGENAFFTSFAQRAFFFKKKVSNRGQKSV